MPIETALLKHAHKAGGRIIAQCPVCAEEGLDKSGQHLVVYEDGRFACVCNPGPVGKAHRAEIFRLVGYVENRPPPKAVRICIATTRRPVNGAMLAKLSR
ncbi:MAG: hypothetical protein LBK99_16650 [Opitutaceae bacterium]|jgi:hypothetical protein|nr:hypothetical protein [Opitutaceae bacterium]